MPRKRATGAARPYPYRQKRRDGTYVERWKVELSLGKGPDGKYRTKQITASTFRECQRKLKEARDRLNLTGDADERSSGSVSRYVGLFMDDARHRLTPKSLDAYQTAARRIDEGIGDMQAHLVRASTVRELEERYASTPGAQAILHTVLRQVLDLAVEDGALQVNPAAAVRRGRRQKSLVGEGRRAFSVPELRMMLTQAAASMPLEVAARMWFRMLTGTRRGEIVGATVEDLHLGGATPCYEVRWSLAEVSRRHGCGRRTRSGWPCGRRYASACPDAVWVLPDGMRVRHVCGRFWLKPPKSGRTRVVPLVPALASMLAEYVRHTASWPNPYGLLFRHGDGSPVTPDEDTADFKRLLVLCGMDPEVRTGHETRYSAVTLLRKAGVDTKTVLEIVGHTSLAVDDIYRTVDMEEKSEAMNELGESLHLPKGLLPGAVDGGEG